MDGLFHRFVKDVSGIELPVCFNNPFYYCRHELCAVAAEELRVVINASDALCADVAAGKMFGVLVVRSGNGDIWYLAGFSGLLCGSNRIDGFVPPVFDFLAPEGYFKREDTNIFPSIKRMNCKIRYN